MCCCRIGISKSSIVSLLKILRSESVEFIVAPYEADAQLAYLATLEADQGGITAVITEDSDLIAYGCKSVRIYGPLVSLLFHFFF